jgi:hypothetical protein
MRGRACAVHAALAESDSRVRTPSASGSREANRAQISWGRIDLDAQRPADHSARAIGAVIERLDSSVLYARILARDGGAGAPAIDPKILSCFVRADPCPSRASFPWGGAVSERRGRRPSTGILEAAKRAFAARMKGLLLATGAGLASPCPSVEGTNPLPGLVLVLVGT